MAIKIVITFTFFIRNYKVDYENFYIHSDIRHEED